MPSDIYVDTSEAERVLNELRDKFSEKTLENRMRKAVSSTARRAGRIIKDDVAAHYYVTRQRVGKDIKPYQREHGGIGCIIPISGVHGTIGVGNAAFKITNKKSATKGSKQARFREVRKKGISTLPPRASGLQGNGPIFIGGGKLNGLTFTRKPDRHLARVTAEAVSHHVSNEARSDIENHLGEEMANKMLSLLSYDAGTIRGD